MEPILVRMDDLFRSYFNFTQLYYFSNLLVSFHLFTDMMIMAKQKNFKQFNHTHIILALILIVTIILLYN